MEEKYKIMSYSIRNSKGYEICKLEDKNFTVSELNEIFGKLIEEGKGNYFVTHEGFCCGVQTVDVSESTKTISLD